jgi:hypothetical protein
LVKQSVLWRRPYSLVVADVAASLPAMPFDNRMPRNIRESSYLEISAFLSLVSDLTLSPSLITAITLSALTVLIVCKNFFYYS